MDYMAKSSNGSSSSSSSPCAACKLLRRRCVENCIFSPHFPPDEPLKFASVHRVFGASNVSKMLQEIAVEQRGDAVSSMVYEANSRIRDPVYGCVGAIANLQRQVLQLQTQLAVSQAQSVYAQLQYELMANSSSNCNSINSNNNCNSNSNSNSNCNSSSNNNSNSMGNNMANAGVIGISDPLQNCTGLYLSQYPQCSDVSASPDRLPMIDQHQHQPQHQHQHQHQLLLIPAPATPNRNIADNSASTSASASASASSPKLCSSNHLPDLQHLLTPTSHPTTTTTPLSEPRSFQLVNRFNNCE